MLTGDDKSFKQRNNRDSIQFFKFAKADGYYASLDLSLMSFKSPYVTSENSAKDKEV